MLEVLEAVNKLADPVQKLVEDNLKRIAAKPDKGRFLKYLVESNFFNRLAKGAKTTLTGACIALSFGIAASKLEAIDAKSFGELQVMQNELLRQKGIEAQNAQSKFANDPSITSFFASLKVNYNIFIKRMIQEGIISTPKDAATSPHIRVFWANTMGPTSLFRLQKNLFGEEAEAMFKAVTGFETAVPKEVATFETNEILDQDFYLKLKKIIDSSEGKVLDSMAVNDPVLNNFEILLAGDPKKFSINIGAEKLAEMVEAYEKAKKEVRLHEVFAAMNKIYGEDLKVTELNFFKGIVPEWFTAAQDVAFANAGTLEEQLKYVEEQIELRESGTQEKVNIRKEEDLARIAQIRSERGIS